MEEGLGARSGDRVVATSAGECGDPNIMRQQYRTLNEQEKAAMQEVKEKGQELYNLIGALGTSRELSLAKTKIEEAVMWTTKHLTA